MSATIRSATLALALALLLSHATFASDCNTGGGNPPPPPIGPITPHTLPLAPAAVKPTLPLVAPAAAPQARVTVVDAMPQSAAQPTTPAVSTARITLVSASADESTTATSSPAPEESEDDTAKLADASARADEQEPELDPALKNLVGTWLAVARHGDGELSTVELQLDDRGWARLTVPGPDGKPATTRQRVELEDDELKLTAPDAEISLGKLIEFDERQLTLARSGGQITFVRP
jgi:hypothetical protein